MKLYLSSIRIEPWRNSSPIWKWVVHQNGAMIDHCLGTYFEPTEILAAFDQKEQAEKFLQNHDPNSTI